MKHRMISLTISIVLFLTIILLVVDNRRELLAILHKTEKNWLFGGFLCYLASYCLRSIRMNLYANDLKKKPLISFNITALHGFSTYFVPLRLGDISLPPLLRLYGNIPIIDGTRILIRTRILDLQGLGFFLLAATLYAPPFSEIPWRGIFFTTALMLMSVPYLLPILSKFEFSTKTIYFSWLHNDMYQRSPRTSEVITSLSVWLFIGLTTFCIIRSIGLQLSFLDVWFVSTVQLPMQLFPIQGVANSGNHEAGWIAALGLFGIPPAESLPLALASHIILICYVSLLGTIAAIIPVPRHV